MSNIARSVRVSDQQTISNFFDRLVQAIVVMDHEIGDGSVPKLVRHTGYEYSFILPDGTRIKLTASVEGKGNTKSEADKLTLSDARIVHKLSGLHLI